MSEQVMTSEQLAATAPGAAGTVLETLRHIVTADGRYRLYAAALGQGQGQFTIAVTEQP